MSSDYLLGFPGIILFLSQVPSPLIVSLNIKPSMTLFNHLITGPLHLFHSTFPRITFSSSVGSSHIIPTHLDWPYMVRFLFSRSLIVCSIDCKQKGITSLEASLAVKHSLVKL